MKLVNRERYISFVLNWIILIFFSYDLIVRFLFRYSVTRIFYDYAVLFKGLIILGLAYLLNKKAKINTSYLLMLFALSLCYIIGQLTLLKSLDIDNILFNGYYFLSCFFSILFLALTINYNAAHLDKFMRLLTIIITINSVFIFFGFIYDIKFLETYQYGTRFGHSGLLLYHSECGYIYFLTLIGLSYEYKIKKSKKYLIIIIFNVLAALLIGTKKATFLAILFSLFFLFENRRFFKSRTFYLFIATTAIIILFFRQALYKILISYFKLFYDIYQRDGFITSFLSYRDVLLKKNLIPYVSEKWQIINYIFGGPSFASSRTELEFFDVFLFFGLIGVVVYVAFFIKLIRKTSKRTLYFATFAILLAALLSGNLLSSVNVIVLYSIIYLRLNNEHIVSTQ